MSGFQIPGLGFAKPNETLPPLPADILAAASSLGDADFGHVKPERPSISNTGDKTVNDSTMDQPSSIKAESPEPMNIDQPEGSPSITHALEAAIGGLGSTTEDNNGAAEGVTEEGGQPEWEVDSSPYESSSESSSSDSSSDEDSDKEGYKLLGVEETARLLLEMEGGSDDENDGKSGKAGGSGQVRTKNEVPDVIIPKPDVNITLDMKVEELGVVEHIVENIMVVKAFTPGEYQVLDAGSVICTADRVVVGVIAETIGKVQQPMYTVMFSTSEDIKEAGLEVGSKVCYPVAHASYVFTQPLKNLKGSDASNLHDEEIAEDEMEFSDDEKEAEYKRQIKQKRKQNKFKDGGPRGGRELHPLRNEANSGPTNGGLNYDDDEDGPYKPLTRPPGFGQAAPSQQGVEEEPLPSLRSNAPRGRRGDFRGRGDRGRGNRGRGGGRGWRGGPGHQGESRGGHSLPPQNHGSSQAQSPNPSPQNQWSGNAYQAAPPYGQQHIPQSPSFNFQYPGPPAQSGQVNYLPVPPPPPPNWQPQAGQNGQGAPGAYINPAFFAALLGQMQGQAQNSQQWQQGGAPPPPPPPPQ